MTIKKIIALFFLVYSGILRTTAQDIVTLKSGKELKSRIIHINTKDVSVIPEGTSDTISLLRNEIAKLQYQKGISVYLSDDEAPIFNKEPANDSLYYLGEKDANRYYRGYKAAATGTLICSFFIPWGLVPAFACSSTPPAINSLGYKDQALFKNSSYFNGYTEQAFKIKKKKIWKNFAIGSGITVGYYMLLLIAASALYTM